MSFATDPAAWVEQTPGRAQHVFLKTLQGREISYAALREQSGRIASALSRRGLNRDGALVHLGVGPIAS
jgi:acyl-CoA synthetase (AMP-forming)/AMP-acid ligase II